MLLVKRSLFCDCLVATEANLESSKLIPFVSNGDWLVVLGLTAFRNSISVYIEPSPRERGRKKTEIIDEGKKSKQLQLSTTACAEGHCPTIVQTRRR